MKSTFFKPLLLCGFFLFTLISQVQADAPSPQVTAGVLDLRQYDLQENGPLRLKGDWKFQPGLVQDWSPEAGVPIEVPGNWAGTEYPGGAMSAQGTGTYFLTILLPGESPDLSLCLPEISTAYELLVNGQLVAKAGQVGEAGESTPLYKPQTIDLETRTGSLQVMIRVSNFHRWRGGILNPIVLGSEQSIEQLNTRTTLEGSVLASLFVILGLIFLGFFAYRPKETYHLWFAISSFLFGINVVQLAHRWGYLLLGEGGWKISVRLEFLVLVGAFTCIVLMFNAFYPGLVSRRAIRRVMGMFALEALFVLCCPFPWATYSEFSVPLNALVMISGIFFMFKAYRQKREASLLLLVLFGATILVGIMTGGMLFQPIGGVQIHHYGIAMITFGVALVLVRRSGRAFNSVEKLSVDLEDANQELEKANIALEERNETLEDEVKRRSEELLAMEKKNHELELEQKKRDLETLSANNLMKLKFKRNLIEELEQLRGKPEDLERELKMMTFRLKGQVATEEKIEALQGDMEKVNSEFYDRLQEKFPKLNKTERELCAYIKLNLSSKDIADLRKTSVNSIHVTRSRLRKKLGLEKGTELQAFIQQI